MSLLALQQEFAAHVAGLLLHAAELGYRVTLGDASRSIEEQRRLISAGRSGIRDPAKGAHVRRLAIDLNLFHGGHYLAASEDYLALGEWWERQNPKFRWGGRFGDGNHFSAEYEGVR